MTHIIELRGQKIELTTEEAKQLFTELRMVFDPVPTILPPFYPTPENPLPPWEITCLYQKSDAA